MKFSPSDRLSGEPDLLSLSGQRKPDLLSLSGRGRLVPSSHKGSEFRYTVVRQFSRGDERIKDGIPVPDSLGKEAFYLWASLLAEVI